MTPAQQTSAGVAKGFTIQVFGVRWQVCPVGVDAELVAHLRGLWSRAIVEPDSPGPAVEELVVAPGPEDLQGPEPPFVAFVGTDPEAAPYALSRTVTMHSIHRRRGTALMLHAVGVAGANGRTVALVAPSGTGKTTAASRLGKPLGYVTDETVIVEGDDRISPYPKPLSIIVDASRPGHKEEFSPDTLGLGPTPKDPTLGAIVIIRRDPAITVPDFELLSLPEAMIATIPETSALPKIPMPLARLARALCQGGGPYRLVYSEIADCVDVLIGLTEGPPAGAPASPEWEHLPDDGRQPLDTPWTTVSWDSVVTRAPWNDAVASEGEVVVLHDHVPSLLNRLGGTLWRLSGDRMSVAELHTRVVEDLGEHPRSNALVLEALQGLVDGGMMQIVDDPAAADR